MIPEAHVPLIQSEVDSLVHDLSTRSPDDLRSPSACDGWEIRDVVGHLIFDADYYLDRITRGLRGDTSLPTDSPGGDAPDFSDSRAFFGRYVDQQARVWRERFGEQLLSTLSARYAALTNTFTRLSPQEWETPCSSWRNQGVTMTRPLRAYVLTIIQELAIHGWDIRSPSDPNTILSAESISLLMEFIPTRFGRQYYADFPFISGASAPVRYRFDVHGDSPSRYNIIVEEGKARMETPDGADADVIFGCDGTTFTLLMYKRFTLESESGTRPHNGRGRSNSRNSFRPVVGKLRVISARYL